MIIVPRVDFFQELNCFDWRFTAKDNVDLQSTKLTPFHPPLINVSLIKLNEELRAMRNTIFLEAQA